MSKFCPMLLVVSHKTAMASLITGKGRENSFRYKV
jgi:hypothetical protein